MTQPNENPADVVVVGAGNAAFTAALAARRAGCRVVVLEKAPEPFRGGNTRFTGGVFRFTYGGLDDLLPIIKDTDDASDVVVDPYSAEAFERDLQRVTGGRTDPLLSRVLIDRSYETVRWMADLGVRFEFSRASPHLPAQSGQRQMRRHPRQQLSRRERFHQVIICAGLKAFNRCLLSRAGGEQDDGK